MRLPAAALAMALLLLGCGGGEKGKLTVSPTELQIFVEVESTVEEMAAIQVTVRPRDGSPDLVVDMEPPAAEGEDWSQLLEKIPAGDYAARASALDGSRRLLFHSVETEQFRVYAGQRTVLKLVLRDPKGGGEVWEPHFVSVRVEGTPAQGSDSAILVRAGGGEGNLRLSGSGDGIFGTATGDPRSEEGAVLGWTPVKLGPNTIELELRDAADRRATTALDVLVDCPEGLTLCLGSCVDTDEDPMHCGTCNRPCESGECLYGFCTGEGAGGGGGPGGGDGTGGEGGTAGAGGTGGSAGSGGAGGTAGTGGSGGIPGTGGTGGGTGGTGGTVGTGGTGGDPGAGGTGGGSGGTGGTVGTGGTGGDPGSGGTGGGSGGTGGTAGTGGTGGDPGTGGTGGDPGSGGTGGFEPDPDLPVAPGQYHYDPVVTSGITDPYAGAWHPSGEYALVASYTNHVFKYDPVTETITQVGSGGTSMYWTGIAFTEDGSAAVLVGHNTSNNQHTGRIFVWDDAAGTLSERTSEKITDTKYQRVKRSPEGELWILGYQEKQTKIVRLWPFDPATGRGAVKASWASTDCQDMAFATDSLGRRAIAVVCGGFTGSLNLWHLDGGGSWVQGNTAGLGNTSRISGRPQGDYALAIGWTSQINSVHRFENGEWIRNQGGWLPGAYQVSFSTDGKRALVLGSRFGKEGQVYEFRHDLLTRQEITNVPIPNMDSSPYKSGTIGLNEALGRPHCDGGIILAGNRAMGDTSGYIIRFDVTNGSRPCP